MRIDLHSHTTASDGLLSATELVERAAGRGVTHLAITDHDSVASLPEAAGVAKGLGIKLIPGIEITTRMLGQEVHVLGLFMTPDVVAAWTQGLKAVRANRVELMCERLRAAGVAITVEDVRAEAGTGVLARPHVARALVKGGYVASESEAFTRFLVEGTPGFVDRPAPTLEEVVQIVRAAGGVTSLAHPGVHGFGKGAILEASRAGIDAVEAIHERHPPSQADAYARWSKTHGMRHTGGSDFHRPSEGGLDLGDFVTPEEEFRTLATLARTRSGTVDAATRTAWLAAGGATPEECLEN